MTPAQYDVIVQQLRLPARSADGARRVILGGEDPSIVAEAVGVRAYSLARTVRSVRRAYDAIAEAGPWRREAATPLPPR